MFKRLLRSKVRRVRAESTVPLISGTTPTQTVSDIECGSIIMMNTEAWIVRVNIAVVRQLNKSNIIEYFSQHPNKHSMSIDLHGYGKAVGHDSRRYFIKYGDKRVYVNIYKGFANVGLFDNLTLDIFPEEDTHKMALCHKCRTSAYEDLHRCTNSNSNLVHGHAHAHGHGHGPNTTKIPKNYHFRAVDSI